MALTKKQKKDRVKDIEDKIKKQKSAVFVSIGGMKNKDLYSLREKLRESSSDLTISKKTLAKIAFSNSNIPLEENMLSGQFGIVFGYQSETDSAKVVNEFSKNNPTLNILGGLLENICIDKEKVVSLASLPSKEVLYSKLLYTLNSPLTNFLGTCKGNIRDLVSLLSKIKQS